jgi:hypothetical protein
MKRPPNALFGTHVTSTFSNDVAVRRLPGQVLAQEVRAVHAGLDESAVEAGAQEVLVGVKKRPLLLPARCEPELRVRDHPLQVATSTSTAGSSFPMDLM